MKITVSGLDAERGLRRFAGDEEAYIYVLRTFTANTYKLLAFFDSFSKDDIEEYEIKVHSLKGSSASISADELAEIASELEKAASARDWDYISKHHPQFVSAIRDLLAGLEEMLAVIDSESKKENKDKPDPAALKKLQTACDNYDMDGVDAVMEEMLKYNYESDDGLVDWLQENIELMNFSEIVERLSGLAE